MDDFYKKLGLCLSVMASREPDNEEFLSRVLDAKESMLSFDPVADADAPLISRLLDDHLKIQAIIKDHFESYEKFMQMYV